MKKEIDAVGNVVNAAAKGKIQEKLKVRETKKKAAKAVTQGVKQGKKTISQATNVASQTVRLASLNVPASATVSYTHLTLPTKQPV